MEVYTVDIDDYRQMLADHLDPIKETIIRLEKQQEKVIDIMSAQAKILSDMNHLEDTVKTKIIESDKVHDALFERMRKVEEKSGDKLWDVLKLIIAAAFGGMVAILAGKR